MAEADLVNRCLGGVIDNLGSAGRLAVDHVRAIAGGVVDDNDFAVRLGTRWPVHHWDPESLADVGIKLHGGLAQVNDRGTGSEQYPPGMMLALLIYCYVTGRFGSRTIEAATYCDVA